jgi:molybdopterin-containing oxidoreductase family iron-sulfur binding subunit
VRRGAELAFGRIVETVPRIERCAVVLAIESDLFDGAPGHLNFARAFANRRQPGDDMLRLYALESTPTLTGASADHHFVHNPTEIDAALRALATELGVGQGFGDIEKPSWVPAVARDLDRNRGRALLHAGPTQPASVHALVHAINGALGAPVDHFAPVESDPADENAALESLVEEMRAGAVDTLLIFGANPVFTAPADLDFAGALRQVPMSVHLGLHVDETARECAWHLPQTHELEAWSDTLAFDGTATIMQPSVRPLFGGWSAHQLVAAALGDARPDGRAIVRETWQQRMGAGDGFESAWVEALRRGVVAGSAAQKVDVSFQEASLASLPVPAAAPGSGVLTALFRPDPFLRDGRQANNAWLQELPRPITKLVWGNAAQIAPADAARLGLSNGDVVELRSQEASLRAPIWILPGQAQGCVTLPLGFGRRGAGRIAEDVGFDAFRLRTRAQPWSAPSLTLVRTGERQRLAATQLHGRMEGRAPIHIQTLDDYRSGERGREAAPEPSLYPDFAYPRHAWAMAIDLNRCIGCGACTAACQAENNIPVVGKEEVIHGREMHWIRVDRYYAGPIDAPETHFQPVPCMHCEKAPCEVVCPVEATVHDSDGLNVMVYNRCVGTRFCSNNCPYKVRRFNFFNYAADDQRLSLSWNPEVSVRARGVMEKCTYCVQRIRQGQIDADRDGRKLRDGDIVTACQVACPTEAIVFGDLNEPESAVNQRKASPLDYALLEELGTRPRTTYGAAVANPNPDLGKPTG